MSHTSSGLRARLHEIIFEADTPAGRLFDLLLIVAIVASVLVVMLESVAGCGPGPGPAPHARVGLHCALHRRIRPPAGERAQPLRYARSFFGMIDLVAILPTYLSVFVPGAQSLLVVRLLRLLRIFRVLKLAEYLRESQVSRRRCARADGRSRSSFSPW